MREDREDNAVRGRSPRAYDGGSGAFRSGRGGGDRGDRGGPVAEGTKVLVLATR